MEPSKSSRVGPFEESNRSRPKVLIAEDSAINQKLALAMLEKLGYVADVVGSGTEAVRALSNRGYGAVLMDCHMPEMNGYEAAAEIRKQEGASGRTPIIAMTGSVMRNDREKCLTAGMDDYIAKPVQLEELRLALERWVGNESRSLGAAASSGGRGSASGAAIDAGRLAELRTLDPPDGPTTLSVLASIFLGDMPPRLTSLRRAVLESNADSVEDLAHYLKGAAANIGATRMAALCAELEDLARSGALTPAPHLLTRLDAEFAHARQALEVQLARS
jgi:CheY-like chemotaxis protein/HPt (histidine-containing phosphotransfer) domain-containing protein